MKNKKIVALLLCAIMLFAAMPFAAYAAPSYWGYDSYNTIKNPGAQEITAYPTTLTKVNATQYKMTSKTDAGTLTSTFEEKSWGMFNLGSWTLVDNSGKTHTFLAASTDWEYVYRTQKTATSKYVWSGGNHGNEVLVSLKFYNGDTGAEINLSNGQSITVNKLHIIEKSKLLFKDDTDGDGYGYKNKTDSYSASDVYANATRKYTITGPQIKLNVDYEYIKDTYHQLSYTCMFPINKAYGNYCDLYNQSGGKIKTVNTATIAQGQFDRPNSATRAVIYGTTDARYKFDVHVNTFVDSLDSLKNSYKTMYWNMNASSNKIYFSKYQDGSATKIASGTQFHTECVWKFFFDADKDGLDDDTATNTQNLVLGKDFFGTHNWKKYYADLTDGVANNTISFTDTDWFTFYYHPDLTEQENISQQNSNALGGVGTVGYDLGTVHNLSKVRVNTFLGNYSGVIAPESIAVEVSTDGTTYTEVGKKTFAKPAADNKTVGWVEFNLNNTQARYVRIKVDLNGVMAFINEIEVYGSEIKVPDPIDPKPEIPKPNIDYSKLTNIALKKDYEAEKYGSYTANLTDGVATNTMSYNNNWFAFANNPSGPQPNGNAPDRIGTVVIDLEDKFDISAVKINAVQNETSGITVPDSVKVYLSNDGKTWGKATSLYVPDLYDTTTDKAFAIEGVVEGTASYVKVEFALGSRMFVFFNEIEVYGTEAEDDDDDETSGGNNDDDDETSGGNNDDGNNGGNDDDDDDENGGSTTEGKLGDIDADSDIDVADYILVKRAVLKNYTLSDAQFDVADVDADNDVDAADYVLVKRIVLGTYTVK